MIQREDFTIYDQVHQMYAEGCQSNEPLEDDIWIAVEVTGYKASYIKVYFDNVQKLWRWGCEISNEY